MIPSPLVLVAWGLRGDEKMIYTLCGAGVGLPTQGFVEWGKSPRKVFRVGIAWGGFAWVSEPWVQ